jgi:hypothetical protein
MLAEQFCPPFQNAASTAFSTSPSSIGASSRMMNGLLPPISSPIGFRLLSLE